MIIRGTEGGGDLVIGLVNNMPARSLRSMEARFSAILHAAGSGLCIRLRCFSTRVADDPDYEPIEALWDSRIDGLMVTGVEPEATDIPDEPLWPVLARLTDWAAEHTTSALWSCMATQAAVYRLSGLRRRRLPAKLSGIYPCHRAPGDHALLDGAPDTWSVPHSRYFDLDPAELAAAGYQFLAYGPGMNGTDGVDSFVITAGRSRFLMLQGHPEYGADSLLLEYRRDIRRFLAGKVARWPVLPARYFDAATADALLALAARSEHQSAEAVIASVDALVGAVPLPHWQPHSARLFGNWIRTLAPQPAAQAMQRAAS